MSKRIRQFLVLTAIIAAAGGATIARADDSSMNPLTGESRAAFDANNPNLSTHSDQAPYNNPPYSAPYSNISPGAYAYRSGSYGPTVEQQPVQVAPSAPPSSY